MKNIDQDMTSDNFNLIFFIIAGLRSNRPVKAKNLKFF